MSLRQDNVIRSLSIFCVGLLIVYFLIPLNPAFAELERMQKSELSKMTAQDGIGFTFNKFRFAFDQGDNAEQALRIISSGSQSTLRNLFWHQAGAPNSGFSIGTLNDPFELEAEGGSPSYVSLMFPNKITTSGGATVHERFDVSFGWSIEDFDIGRLRIRNGVNPATFLQFGGNDEEAQLGLGFVLDGSGGLDADQDGTLSGGDDFFIGNLWFARSSSSTINSDVGFDATPVPSRTEFFETSNGSNFEDDLLIIGSIGCPIATISCTQQGQPLSLDFFDDGGTAKVRIDVSGGSRRSLGTIGINNMSFARDEDGEVADLGRTVIKDIELRTLRFTGPQ